MKNLFIILFLLFCVGCEEKEQTNNLPTCRIRYPYNNNSLRYGQTIKISVDAEDSDGTIEQLILYINDSSVCHLNTPPYFYNWPTTFNDIGTHTITAKATDNKGNITSDKITLHIYRSTVDFTANFTSIYEYCWVHFTTQSTDQSDTWYWDFGDGDTSSVQNPIHLYSSPGNFTVSLIVSNSSGTDSLMKSNYISVNSVAYDSFTDARDNQIYKTVKIGNQVWMAENLNYETSNGSWVCEGKEEYGRYYDWETAVNSCPDGWHLSSVAEWKELENYLINNGFDWKASISPRLIGKSLASKSGWKYSSQAGDIGHNQNNNNSSGFNALPAGILAYGGGWDGYNYFSQGIRAVFWTSDRDTIEPETVSSLIHLEYELNYRSVGRGPQQEGGLSVRCIKD